MSLVNVENETTDGLLFTLEESHKIVTRCLQSSNYQLQRSYLEDLGDIGGFLGKYYRLKISVVYENEVKLLSFFIKSLPKGTKALAELAERSFKKEQFMYECFFPNLEGLSFLTFKPKFYLCKLNEAIVLEDLSERGFRAGDTRSFLGYDDVCSALKQIARLHACTIVFEEKRTRELGRTFRADEEYKDYMYEVNLTSSGPAGGLFDICITRLAQIALRFPEIPKKMSMSEFQSRVIQAGKGMFVDTKKSANYRNVICQGDMWAPNIMLKRNQGVVECYLVDYQLIRYCPLMTELSFFLYTCTRKQLRKYHLKEFLDMYYQEFSEVLASCEIAVNDVYSYDQFMESYYKIRPTTISKALSYFQMGLLPPERLSQLRNDFEEFDYVLKNDRLDFFEKYDIFKYEIFNNTFNELFEDLYDSLENKKL